MRKISVIIIFIFYSAFSVAQYTHADTLRGSNGPARSWWDVTKYDLHVKFNLDDSTIGGFNNISYKVVKKELKNGNILQIDLQEPLVLDSILMTYTVSEYNPKTKKIFKVTGGALLKPNNFEKDGNAYFIKNIRMQELNAKNQLEIYYHGKPRVAKNPPWDGGIVWKRDEHNNPWISLACQGLGASVWYPCKDYQGDEPDSAELHITASAEFVSVANGKLRSTIDNKDGTKTYSWAVVNQINNYDIVPYIGKYVNFNEVYKGEKGDLEMNYWVLDYNLEKAKKQFADATKMMKAFEYWFGPYPFYEDGYKLVDAPYVGMENQSAIAYGNHYQNGYYRTGDLSGSGWGLKWDYIIVHESGHEWFGNNITTKDIADMWVHEGFATYSEILFIEYYFGKNAGSEYVIGLRKRIFNDIPIIGQYGVNNEGSTDMYYKGANLLHTIRQIINDDEKFRMMLRGLNKTFYHQTVTSKQVEDFINKNSGIDLSKVFDQYLRTTMIPTLEYKFDGYDLSYRWTNVVKGFNMPLKINFKKQVWIKPTEQWKTLHMYPEGKINFAIDDNFYIKTNKVN
ncbi:MAG TPA: M1 family metallopeptidase [Chitinophagaceae bacterium]